jgi:hypothetical protein
VPTYYKTSTPNGIWVHDNTGIYRFIEKRESAYSLLNSQLPEAGQEDNIPSSYPVKKDTQLQALKDKVDARDEQTKRILSQSSLPGKMGDLMRHGYLPYEEPGNSLALNTDMTQGQDISIPAVRLANMSAADQAAAVGLSTPEEQERFIQTYQAKQAKDKEDQIIAETYRQKGRELREKASSQFNTLFPAANKQIQQEIDQHTGQEDFSDLASPQEK